MADPNGKLTPAQFEIMQLLWDSEAGLSVMEIWEVIREQREISRTTILNLVDRLEKRGWLSRRKVDGTFRYRPTVDRRSTESELATEFVNEFFAGSAAKLVLSLLGSRRVSKAELQRIRQLLQGRSPDSADSTDERAKK